MNVTIIGTGNMARGIATRLLAGGNGVTLVGTETGKARALAAELGGAATAAATGSPIPDDVVVLAVPYGTVAGLLQEYGESLAGKVLVDITNPLNATYSGLVTAPGTSAAEEIARSVPAGTRVVKAFNTTFAGTLLANQVAGQPLDVFVAGDDVEAKASVIGLVESGGLRAIDAGPLERARQLEALGLLHITLQGTQGTGFMSAVKILS